MSIDYRNFLALSYEELEGLNLEAKQERVTRVSADKIREKRLAAEAAAKGIPGGTPQRPPPWPAESQARCYSLETAQAGFADARERVP